MCNVSKEFSMEESENIITNFQSGDSPMANFLNELSDVSKIKLPPVPSFDNQPSNIRSFFSARKGATVVAIEVAILATAVASAAALSGIGPEPVVNFVKAAATQVQTVAKSVSTFIAEDDGAAPNQDQQIPNPQSTAAAPVATETPSAQSTLNKATKTSETSPKQAPKVHPNPTKSGIGVAAPTKKSSDGDDGDDGDDD